MVLDGRNVIPAGTSVAGTVTAVKAARKRDRAMLDLGLNYHCRSKHAAYRRRHKIAG